MLGGGFLVRGGFFGWFRGGLFGIRGGLFGKTKRVKFWKKIPVSDSSPLSMLGGGFLV